MEKIDELQHAFMEKHTKDADEIECNVFSGKVMRAIYYSPEYKALSKLREFFALVKEMEKKNENDHGESNGEGY